MNPEIKLEAEIREIVEEVWWDNMSPESEGTEETVKRAVKAILSKLREARARVLEEVEGVIGEDEKLPEDKGQDGVITARAIVNWGYVIRAELRAKLSGLKEK